jgi:hypothetical protein
MALSENRHSIPWRIIIFPHASPRMTILLGG